MVTLITTEMVHARHRFDFWRDLVCDKIVHLSIERTHPERAFFGSIQIGQVGRLELAALNSTAQHVGRTARHISDLGYDQALFCFQLAGRAHLIHDGRTTEIAPGDWAYCDTTQPFQWAFPGRHTQLALKIPKCRLAAHSGLPAVMPVLPFSGARGLEKIVFDTVTSIWQQADHLDAGRIEALERIVAELLATALSGRLSDDGSARRSHSVRLIEAKAIIRDQLENPGLSAASIAHQLHMSARYLHFLFHNEGISVGTYIRQARLERCKRDLEDPLLRGRSITEILYSWGFSDSSHFSKLFKKNFGMSPRQCRPAPALAARPSKAASGMTSEA